RAAASTSFCVDATWAAHSAQARRCPRTARARTSSSVPSTYSSRRREISRQLSIHTLHPEELAHAASRLVELRLRGADAAAEDLGDLLVREPLDVVQHQ